MIRRRVLLSSLPILLAVGGCTLGEDLGGRFAIHNESDQPLYDGQARIDPHGGSRLIGITGCGGPLYTLFDAQGRPAAVLDEEWCAGDVWTIYDPEDSMLTRDGK